MCQKHVLYFALYTNFCENLLLNLYLAQRSVTCCHMYSQWSLHWTRLFAVSHWKWTFAIYWVIYLLSNRFEIARRKWAVGRNPSHYQVDLFRLELDRLSGAITASEGPYLTGSQISLVSYLTRVKCALYIWQCAAALPAVKHCKLSE